MTRDLGSPAAATIETQASRASARRVPDWSRMTVEAARRLPDEPLFRRVLDVDPELLLPYLTVRIGSTQRLALGRVAPGDRGGSCRRLDPHAATRT